MRSTFAALLGKQGRADGLQCKEEDHPTDRCQEEHTTAYTVNHERSATGPEQIPNLQDTVDEELV